MSTGRATEDWAGLGRAGGHVQVSGHWVLTPVPVVPGEGVQWTVLLRRVITRPWSKDRRDEGPDR